MLILSGIKYDLPCLKLYFLFSSYLFLYNLIQLSKATFPKVTITFNLFKLEISILKYLEQLLSSLFSGLSSGGTHFKMLVTYALSSFRPSFIFSEIGIIEMGANHIGEINDLCAIAAPTHGYITNFGKAHLEGFGNERGVVKGKSELYKYIKNRGGLIFVNADDNTQLNQSLINQPLPR
mgnify:CR=1 FL=1